MTKVTHMSDGVIVERRKTIEPRPLQINTHAPRLVGTLGIRL